MHRVLLPFDFLEPASVEEAAGLVDGQSARALAGGIDLVLKMRLRQVTPDTVVSLQKLPGLGYVRADDAALRFGALATLDEIERSPAVRERWPLLAEALASIVSVQAKATGTAVGNLCVGTPASDIATALYALSARIKLVGVDSWREMPIEEFFVAAGRTAVRPHEIVTEVSVPSPVAGSMGAFVKLSKTAEDIAKVNVAVMITMADGECTGAKIALGSVASTPVRARGAEEALEGRRLDAKAMEEAAGLAAESVVPISDVRSTATYRKRMVRVLVRDALATTASRAPAGGASGA